MFERIKKWWKESSADTFEKFTITPARPSSITPEEIKYKAAHLFLIRLYYQNKELHYPDYEPQLCVMHFDIVRWNSYCYLENTQTITFPKIYCHIRIDSFGLCDTNGKEIFRTELHRHIDILPLGGDKFIEVEFRPGAISWKLSME